LLIEASKRYGIPEAKYTEVLETQGHWWERWRESLRLYRITCRRRCVRWPKMGTSYTMAAPVRQLLPGIRHVLKVLIVAPMDFRIELVRAQQGMDVEALDSIFVSWTACAGDAFARY